MTRKVDTHTDYYPFGMLLPNRHASSSAYRYGFNGMEKDDEIKGEGNSMSTTFRSFDPRIGRWFSVDPKTALLPFETPYSFANNMPIMGADPEGDVCVPCVIILIALMTAPEVAVAPTFDTAGDAKAYGVMKNMKNQWMLNGVVAGGLAAGGTTSSYILKELQAQVYVGLGSNTIAQSINYARGNGFSVTDIIVNSLVNIDVFDAGIGKFKISGKIGKLDLDKIKNVILSATIDLTPSEVSVLGLNKDKTSFTIDAIFNSIAVFTDAKLGGIQVSKALKSILSKADKTAQSSVKAELKKQLGDNYNEVLEEFFQEAARIRGEPTFQEKAQDNTNVGTKNNKKDKVKEKTKYEIAKDNFINSNSD